jgi:chromosome segregation ATPase
MRLFAAALLFGVAGPLNAQQTSADTGTESAQGYAPGQPVTNPVHAEPRVIAGSIILPDRSEAQLQVSIAASEEDLRRADARLSQAKESRTRSKAMVDQQGLDLRQLETSIDKADKDKHESAKRQLETQKKALEGQRQWAERLEAVDQAELDAARQASEVAFAQRQALGLESQLARARSGAENPAGGKPLSGESSSMVVRQLELQTLEAQQKFRKLAHELGQQEDNLAGMRIDLYKSARQ